MQRKNYSLKHSRSAMAMIMAIMVIVIIGTIMALSLAMTAQTSKQTTKLYLYEQSVLLAQAATEYALLQIADVQQNSSNACTPATFNFTQDTIYDINISIEYIYTAGVCTDQFATVQTPEQNGSALIDVAVSVTDSTVTSEPIRYFQRTLQKL